MDTSGKLITVGFHVDDLLGTCEDGMLGGDQHNISGRSQAEAPGLFRVADCTLCLFRLRRTQKTQGWMEQPRSSSWSSE